MTRLEKFVKVNSSSAIEALAKVYAAGVMRSNGAYNAKQFGRECVDDFINFMNEEVK